MKEFNEFKNKNFEKGVIVEEGPKHEVEERPKHEVEERPRSIEEKINFIINFSAGKTQLLELKKILVELEFYGKKEEKGIQENDERKIRRR